MPRPARENIMWHEGLQTRYICAEAEVAVSELEGRVGVRGGQFEVVGADDGFAVDGGGLGD